jgi:hypothetical protein
VLESGTNGGVRYELDLSAGASVSGCVIRGAVRDPRGALSSSPNVLNAPLPGFDDEYVPQAPEYKNAGYRPMVH